MVVDDSSTIRTGITRSLEHRGYAVIEASDGIEALALLERNSIDLMVTDLNMPNLDGIGLTEQARKLKGYRFLPIILLTSEDKNEFHDMAKKMGVSAWLSKPFEQNKLAKIVDMLTSM